MPNTIDITTRLPVFMLRTNTLVCGPTSSGKSEFIREVLKRDECFGPESLNSDEVYKDRKIYVLTAAVTASEWNDYEVVTDLDIIISKMETGDFEPGSVVIIDDLMSKFKGKFAAALTHHVSVTTHHADIYTFILTQEYFHGDSVAFRRQIQNYVLFKQNKRVMNTIIKSILGESNELLMTIYNIVTSVPYRPLVLVMYKPETIHTAYAGLDGPVVKISKKSGELDVNAATFG